MPAESQPVADWRPENPQQFVEDLWPHARRAANELGVKPGVLIAQAALESGWGKHQIRFDDERPSFNLFGIKADGRWDGDRVGVSTLEYRDGVARRERAEFRAYDSLGAAFDDYVDFIQSNPRYGEALAAAGSEQGYVQGLARAGYATDPRYADKILSILERPEFAATVTASAEKGLKVPEPAPLT
jgi:flagellar protein FlgJ